MGIGAYYLKEKKKYSQMSHCKNIVPHDAYEKLGVPAR